jgi:hypothetical protein
LEELMQLVGDRKRLGLAIALSVAMLALCTTLMNQPNCEYGARTGSVGAGTLRPAGMIRKPGLKRGPHPIPWVKVVVAHAISIASYLAA